MITFVIHWDFLHLIFRAALRAITASNALLIGWTQFIELALRIVICTAADLVHLLQIQFLHFLFVHVMISSLPQNRMVLHLGIRTIERG